MKTGDKEKVRKGANMNGEKTSVFKKIGATLCHHCPLCNHARKNPDSGIGKMLHHKYHADNCPFWKAEIEVYGESKKTNPSELKALMLWKVL